MRCLCKITLLCAQALTRQTSHRCTASLVADVGTLELHSRHHLGSLAIRPQHCPVRMLLMMHVPNICFSVLFGGSVGLSSSCRGAYSVPPGQQEPDARADEVAELAARQMRRLRAAAAAEGVALGNGWRVDVRIRQNGTSRGASLCPGVPMPPS